MAILFYDGNCGLCQRSVRFIYYFDKKKVIHFAPLNGSTYRDIYQHDLDELTTVKFYYQNKTYEKSEAVFKVCSVIGGMFSWVCLFRIIPVSLRDTIYDQIAKRRKHISCILITQDERFLN